MDTNGVLEHALDQQLNTNQNINDDNTDYSSTGVTNVDDYIDHDAEPTISPHIQYSVREIHEEEKHEIQLGGGVTSSTLQFNATDDLPRYQLAADDKVMLRLEVIY